MGPSGTLVGDGNLIARPARGRLPFDLLSSEEAVRASRSDVAFDTADSLFRFGVHRPRRSWLHLHSGLLRGSIPGPAGQDPVVRPRQEPDERLLALAQAQSGVITLGQATDLGLGPWAVRRLATGPWQRLAPGVFHLGLGAPPWEAQAWAGLLLGGPRARIAGKAAAHLHGLESEAPTTIEVLVPLDRQVRDRSPWTFRRERPGVRDPRSVGLLSRTTVEDTVLDMVDRATTAREVGGLVASAVQQRRTTVVRLRRAAASRARLRHRRLVDALLDDVAVGAETPLEIAYLHKVERAHGLPRGVRQHRAQHSTAIRDVLYEEFAVVVELDGRMGHEGTGRFRDLERDNAAAVTGELTLRYGWHDVQDRACSAAFQLGAVLARRGWPEEPRRCRCCRQVVGTIV